MNEKTSFLLRSSNCILAVFLFSFATPEIAIAFGNFSAFPFPPDPLECLHLSGKQHHAEAMVTATATAAVEKSKSEINELIRIAENPAADVDLVFDAIKELGVVRAKEALPVLHRLADLPYENFNYYFSVTMPARAILNHYFGELKYHRLYREVEDFSDFIKVGPRIKSAKMKKDGGTNKLLGGKLAGQIFARRLPKESLRAWELALKSLYAWDFAGFDYVPIEPIISREAVEQFVAPAKLPPFSVNQNEKLVFTRVLGLDFGMYEELGDGEDVARLQKDMEKIKGVLKKLHVIHGHDHPENFCIREVNGKNRIYMIDFDAAYIYHPQ